MMDKRTSVTVLSANMEIAHQSPERHTQEVERVSFRRVIIKAQRLVSMHTTRQYKPIYTDGSVTPIMVSRVINDSSACALQSSVPSGRAGTTR